MANEKIIDTTGLKYYHDNIASDTFAPKANPTFTGTVDTSSGNVKISVLNAKTSSSSTTYGPGTSSQVLKSNGTNCYWGSDANDTTTIGGGAIYKAKNAYGGYSVLITNRDNDLVPTVSGSGYTTATSKTMNTSEAFDPFGIYAYTSSSSNRAAGALCSSSTFIIYSSFDIRYAFNITADLTANDPFYIVAQLQSDGQAKLVSPYYSQALPSSDDEKIYILLGQALSTTNISLVPNHPIYYYKDSRIYEYCGDDIVDKTSAQSISGTKTFTSPIYLTNSNYHLEKNTDANVIDFTVNGTKVLTIGASSTAINSVFRANADNSKDLGSSTVRWKDFYLAGNLSDGTNSVSVANIAKTNADNNFSVAQTFKDITLYSTSGDSPRLTFQRGTLTDTYNDWSIYDSGGYLYIQQRGSGSTGWGTMATFTQSGVSFGGTVTIGTSGSVASGNTSAVTGGAVYNALQGYVPTSRTVNSKALSSDISLTASDVGAVEKVTYEYNREISFGSSGYLKIGSFSMYDSNITIDIDSTTNTTYHATVVIATQNVSESSIGSAHVVSVYGDASDTITSAIRVVWSSGSRNYNVYFVPSAWSKNLIHIRAMGLYGTPTDVCVSQEGTAPTSTSGLEAVNVLKNNFLSSSTSYVSSVNGSSGAITNVAKTNVDNQFSSVQSFTSGLYVGNNSSKRFLLSSGESDNQIWSNQPLYIYSKGGDAQYFTVNSSTGAPSTYGVQFPSTASYTANKTLATTDDIPTISISATETTLNVDTAKTITLNGTLWKLPSGESSSNVVKYYGINSTSSPIYVDPAHYYLLVPLGATSGTIGGTTSVTTFYGTAILYAPLSLSTQNINYTLIYRSSATGGILSTTISGRYVSGSGIRIYGACKLLDLGGMVGGLAL